MGRLSLHRVSRKDEVELQSKSGETLTRYFPEIVAALPARRTARFVTDGELLVPAGDGSDFDALLQRIHPAESRVRKLAEETPATYVLFDLLVSGGNKALRASRCASAARTSRISCTATSRRMQRLHYLRRPATSALAKQWLAGSLARLDGVIAKRDVPYAFGSRDAVVEGQAKLCRRLRDRRISQRVRTARSPRFCSASTTKRAARSRRLRRLDGRARSEARGRVLKPIVEPPGFTGSAPGGPSRWRRAADAQWFPVRPEIVVEVAFDHMTARRFRHAARLLRWRPDKAPRQCTMEQLLNPTERSGFR